jgi:hypothetical protein
MTHSEQELQRSRAMGLRIPEDLYQLVAADAAKLGVSISDAARWRLKTGHCPTLEQPNNA